MDDDLKRRCENSFYSELYHFDETSQDLVLDQTTGRIMLRKVLEIYEIAVFKWLQENPNSHIPVVYTFHEENDKLTILEEYIQGDTLDVFLQTRNPDLKERLRILFDICDALDFLHNAPIPIIHRDIKAKNIMLTSDGIVKLIDFDASKSFHPGKEVDTTLIGTVGSAAPEQYGFRQSDARTDIYSLGILIKELFPNDNRFSGIIDKATQMEPKLRYQRVSELKSALEKEFCQKTKQKSSNPVITIFFLAIAILVVYFAIRHFSKPKGDVAEQDLIEKTENSDSKDLSSEPEAGTTNISPDHPDTSEVITSIGKTDNNSGKSIGLLFEESSWYINPSGNSGDIYIRYAAIISNSSDKAVEFPGIRVTAKNKEKIVLGTDDMIGQCIMPGDTIILNNFISAFDCKPADVSEVDFSFCNGDPSSSLSSATSSDFIIKGINEHMDSLFGNVTGEITSKYQDEINISITAVFRKNGKLVASESDYIDNLKPDNPTAFQINISSELPEHDSVEVMAKKW